MIHYISVSATYNGGPFANVVSVDADAAFQRVCGIVPRYAFDDNGEVTIDLEKDVDVARFIQDLLLFGEVEYKGLKIKLRKGGG